MSERERQWFTVPAGQKATQCRSMTCGRPIFFITHPRTGRPHPIDCDVEGGVRPSEKAHDPRQLDIFSGDKTQIAHDGRGVSHFETCADAAYFRRGVGA